MYPCRIRERERGREREREGERVGGRERESQLIKGYILVVCLCVITLEECALST